jgi:recombination protein RecT
MLNNPKESTKFIASIVTAVNNNSQLAECAKSTILSAALLGHSLNLSPSASLGQYFIVPFDDRRKGCKVATFQLGYKGFIQLAIRSGQYKSINVISVKEGELVSYNPFNDEVELKPITNYEERKKAKTVGYYAFFELVNGFRKSIYWSKEQMLEHAKKYSAGYQADLKKGTSYTFWAKDFDAMAYKTLLRQLISKWGIMSIEMEKGYVGDQAVINADGSSDYVDNATRYPQIADKEEDRQQEEAEEELPKVEGEIVEDKKS